MAEKGKYIYEWPRPMVTVDAVVFDLSEGRTRVLLVKRGKEPYKGRWAVPGGFIEMDEELEDAVARELQEETGLTGVPLEQMRTFGRCGRDPRGRQISVAFTGIATAGQDKIRAGDDAAKARWFDIEELPEDMAFDHDEILNYAITRLRYKLEYSAVGFQLLPECFSLRELQEAYETVLGEELDKGNFRSKLRKRGVVEATDCYQETGGRPARLYRFRDNAVAEIKTRRLFP